LIRKPKLHLIVGLYKGADVMRASYLGRSLIWPLTLRCTVRRQPSRMPSRGLRKLIDAVSIFRHGTYVCQDDGQYHKDFPIESPRGFAPAIVTFMHHLVSRNLRSFLSSERKSLASCYACYVAVACSHFDGLSFNTVSF